MSSNSYKNVVSIQTSIGATGPVASGLTTAAPSGDAASSIVKHRGVVLAHNTAQTLTVIPTYYGADGSGLAGVTLTVTNGQSPLELSLRMKSFTGLTGGTIHFLA